MLKKPRRKQNQRVGYWAKKADKKLQELGRIMYKDEGCLVCGGEYSTLHHYHFKSRSTHLRYNWKNLIPICAKCHYKLHLGYPEIQNAINRIKGDDWVKEIEAEYRKGVGMSAGGYVFYRNKYNSLCNITPVRVK